MKKLSTFSAIWLSLLVGILCIFNQAPRSQPLLLRDGGASFTGSCAPSTTFVNRLITTVALQKAIDTFMCGLVTDSLLTNVGSNYCGSLFDAIDALWLDTIVNSTLNMCGTQYTPFLTSPQPTFVPFTGFHSDGTNFFYVNSNFNPSTAVGANFQQNSAHWTVWDTQGSASTSANGQFQTSAATINVQLIANHPTGTLARVNDAGGVVTQPTGTSQGWWGANRDTSTTRQGYTGNSTANCGTVFGGGFGAPASTALQNGFFYFPGNSADTIGMVTWGASLNPTQMANLCKREFTFCHNSPLNSC